MDGFVERPTWPADQDEFRTAVRQWIDGCYRDDMLVRDWWRELAEAGLTAPTWPRAHGGLGLTTRIQEIVEEELSSVRVAPPVHNDGFRGVAPALRQFLPLDNMATWLEPLLGGVHRWTVLVDEPADGEQADDVRAVSVRDWKYITVDAVKLDVDPLATHAIVVVRSNAASTGRRGLTCFLVDLRDESIHRDDGVARIDALRLLPDRILGNEHQGWEVVKFTANTERSLAGRIRRGMLHLPSGELAGALDLSLTDAVQAFPPPRPPPDGIDRRQRG